METRESAYTAGFNAAASASHPRDVDTAVRATAFREEFLLGWADWLLLTLPGRTTTKVHHTL